MKKNINSIKSIKGGRVDNQDFTDSRETKFGFLIVVCDGMGGANGGALASKLATEVILDDISHSKSEDPLNALFNAIHKANFEIFRRSIQNPDLKGMGTTLTCLLLTKEKAYVCHVGDSRVYQFRDSQIIFRTNDHSKVYEMVKRGIITEEEAKTHPESNIITRALGIEPGVDIEFNQQLYKKGDRFLLCTDGVHGLLSDAEIIQSIKISDVEAATNNLIEKANQRGIEKGGKHDNMTAAIAEVDKDSISESVPNKKISLKKKKYFIFALLIPILFFTILFFLNETYRVKPIKNKLINLTKNTEANIHIVDSIRKENKQLNKKLNNNADHLKNITKSKDSLITVIIKFKDSLNNLTKENKSLNIRMEEMKKKLKPKQISDTIRKYQQEKKEK